MSVAAAILARLGIDTSGWKKDLKTSTTDLQSALDTQAKAIDKHSGLTLNSSMKVKRAIKAMGADVLSGADPVQVLIGSLGRLSMMFKGGLAFGVGTTLMAMVGKASLDARKEVQALHRELRTLFAGTSHDGSYSSLENMKANLEKMEKAQEDARTKLDGIWDRAKLSMGDWMKGDFSNGLKGSSQIQAAKDYVTAKKAADMLKRQIGEKMLEQANDKASEFNNQSIGENVSKEAGDYAALQLKRDQADRKLKEKLGDRASDKTADPNDKDAQAIKLEHDIEIKQIERESDAVYKKYRILGDELNVRREILDAEDDAVKALDAEISGIKRKIEIEHGEEQDKLKVDLAEKEAAQEKLILAREQAAKDAEMQVAITQAQMAGHMSLAERLEVEQKYHDRILKAQREGNTELADQLGKLQQLEITAKGYANWLQTPEQRRERQQKERETERTQASHDRQKQNVERDMDRGIDVTNQGRRGDLKREILSERIAAENDRRAKNGSKPMTPEEERAFTHPKNRALADPLKLRSGLSVKNAVNASKDMTPNRMEPLKGIAADLKQAIESAQVLKNIENNIGIMK